jgi:hypothetical protein
MNSTTMNQPKVLIIIAVTAPAPILRQSTITALKENIQ